MPTKHCSHFLFSALPANAVYVDGVLHCHLRAPCPNPTQYTPVTYTQIALEEQQNQIKLAVLHLQL